jgi:ubiquinone/menaquinone biosynthesis C-methylase UbiE
MAGKVCPFWVGYLLVTPLRRLYQNPDKILGPYIKAGMMVLDVGCAMGFFALPLAKMVGPEGKVLCVDVQVKMLRALHKRALKTGVADRMVTRLGNRTSLGLNDFDQRIDFALAFAVVHEVPDIFTFLGEISQAMKFGSRCLVAEPRGRVSAGEFEATLSFAKEQGLRVVDRPRVARSRAALLEKRQQPVNERSANT